MNIDNVIYIAIVIYSIILHEIAHGYVARIFGDKTAERAGRLTLNPTPHIDPVGSVIIPVLSVISGTGVLGWAKGVPINLYNLGGSKMKEFLVSAAGIITNLLLAIIFIMLIKFSIFSSVYNELFVKIIVVNIGLGFFNLLPVPPFDGMSMLRAIFPSLKHRYQAFEHNPIVMIVTVVIAAQIFGLFYKDILDFVFNLFF